MAAVEQWQLQGQLSTKNKRAADERSCWVYGDSLSCQAGRLPTRKAALCLYAAFQHGAPLVAMSRRRSGPYVGTPCAPLWEIRSGGKLAGFRPAGRRKDLSVLFESLTLRSNIQVRHISDFLKAV